MMNSPGFFIRIKACIRLWRAAPALLEALRNLEDEFNIAAHHGPDASYRRQFWIGKAQEAIYRAGSTPIGGPEK